AAQPWLCSSIAGSLRLLDEPTRCGNARQPKMSICPWQNIPAVDIEADVRARCKPGAAMTPKRIVSTPCLVLGTPLRFSARNYPMHRSRMTTQGFRLIVFFAV
ncbi:MAG: hypothetical protein ACM37Z_13985, partial [Deltaproteobacteria bacterium]